MRICCWAVLVVRSVGDATLGLCEGQLCVRWETPGPTRAQGAPLNLTLSELPVVNKAGRHWEAALVNASAGSNYSYRVQEVSGWTEVVTLKVPRLSGSGVSFALWDGEVANTTAAVIHSTPFDLAVTVNPSGEAPVRPSATVLLAPQAAAPSTFAVGLALLILLPAAADDWGSVCKQALAGRPASSWTIVVGGPPLHCTADAALCSPVGFEAFSKVLEEESVDLHISGGVRAYERAFPMKDGQGCADDLLGDPAFVDEPCGPMHLVLPGAQAYNTTGGGPPAPWTAARSHDSSGFVVVDVINSTHLGLRAISDTGGDLDYAVVFKPRPEEKSGSKEEDFLTTLFWVGFVVAQLMCTSMFVRWVFSDGLSRRASSLHEVSMMLNGQPSEQPERVLSGDAL
mmetsp:Transcript_57887/g.133733  ORF Transcript_57887/g.133733 Transcript_57887/m.133733 type:complete len:399 (-) Transcript_57887:13-1209(-)